MSKGITEKAEHILRKMKKRNRKPHRPYKGPPDMDFLIQHTTGGTGETVLDQFNQSTLDKVGEFTPSGLLTIVGR